MVINSAVDPEQATLVQTDIAKIEAAMENLLNAGETLFADKIDVLKQKRDALIAEAQAYATGLEAVEKSFVTKYGSGVAHTIEIVLLIAILSKLFGVV